MPAPKKPDNTVTGSRLDVIGARYSVKNMLCYNISITNYNILLLSGLPKLGYGLNPFSLLTTIVGIINNGFATQPVPGWHAMFALFSKARRKGITLQKCRKVQVFHCAQTTWSNFLFCRKIEKRTMKDHIDETFFVIFVDYAG